MSVTQKAYIHTDKNISGQKQIYINNSFPLVCGIMGDLNFLYTFLYFPRFSLWLLSYYYFYFT